jgi:hypothetical protein
MNKGWPRGGAACAGPAVQENSTMPAIRYSVITPSRGDRPAALAHAIDSVFAAADNAALPHEQIEVLVGFDGVKGRRVHTSSSIRYYDFPADNDYGNAIRNGLLKASKGTKVLFLDDDNALTEQAFAVYECFTHIEMLVARIDISRAHPKPWIPVIEQGKEPFFQGNVDPLCLCLSRELVTVRCGGWLGTGYEADYLNMFRYFRRTKSIHYTEKLVGIYDAGRGLDDGALNFRQQALLS